MIIKEKSVEYYFNSKEYNEEQIIESMKKEQLGFEKKNAEMDIILNEYGIYVATLKFENNRMSIINSNIEFLKDKIVQLKNKTTKVKNKMPIVKDKILNVKNGITMVKDTVLLIKTKLPIIGDKVNINNNNEINYIKNELKDVEKSVQVNNYYEEYTKKQRKYGEYKTVEKTYQPI